MVSVFKVLLVAVLALMGADGGCDRSRYDVPAGSTGGDSAGNNQPDGGRVMACTIPDKPDVELMSYVEYAGVVYLAAAYLLDEDCNMADVSQDVLRVTLVATDASGRRLPPAHNSYRSPSPYHVQVNIAVATGYSINLVATSNMTAAQVIDNEVEFIACQLVPVSGQGPTSSRVSFVNGARNAKVECLVTA